ncbi:MAG: SDR family NAD(P)-dependent oxidoreductase [Microvirga sp.]
MQLRFDARAVIVTGAAQGIGRAIATAFRDAGARVHVADLDAAGVRQTAEALGATAHALDLSERASAHRLVADVAAAEGRLDILALAAGGVRGQVGRAIEEVSKADWRVLFEANVDGAFWLAQAAAPLMKRAGWGRIVTISSGAGLRPSLTGIQAYAAAKHALVGLTKQLSWELAPHGVTVNSVAPGFVLSNPATQRQWQAYGPDGQKRLVDAIHAKRLGTPDDIAAATLFFASEPAAWITGRCCPSMAAGREAPASPGELADSHKAGAQFPSPLWGRRERFGQQMCERPSPGERGVRAAFLAGANFVENSLDTSGTSS